MTRNQKDDGHITQDELFRSKTHVSHSMNKKAREYLPGGGSRSTIYYSPYPQFFARGEGCWLQDVDGNRFLDFSCNHTSLVLGYGHPEVQRAIRKQLAGC